MKHMRLLISLGIYFPCIVISGALGGYLKSQALLAIALTLIAAGGCLLLAWVRADQSRISLLLPSRSTEGRTEA